MRDSFLTLLWRRFQRLGVNAVSPGLRWAAALSGGRGEKATRSAPVFIIGAPRTGSTIFYQALTNHFDVLYFDNIVAFWCQAILFGFKRSFKRYGNAPHDCFSSNYGATDGGHSPSECGEFWYRWLPKDQHFVPQVDSKIACAIRQEVNEVVDYFGKPLVFKNLNAGQRLRLIAQAFPNARIIFIRRDPRFVLRSILAARKRIGVKPGQWWSVRPPHYERYLGLPEPEMCAAQIYHIEKQILEDLPLFPREQIRVIDYQELSASKLVEIGSWLGLSPRAGGWLPEFTKDSLEGWAQQELDALERAISRYPFAELRYEI